MNTSAKNVAMAWSKRQAASLPFEIEDALGALLSAHISGREKFLKKYLKMSIPQAQLVDVGVEAYNPSYSFIYKMGDDYLRTSRGDIILFTVSFKTPKPRIKISVY